MPYARRESLARVFFFINLFLNTGVGVRVCGCVAARWPRARRCVGGRPLLGSPCGQGSGCPAQPQVASSCKLEYSASVVLMLYKNRASNTSQRGSHTCVHGSLRKVAHGGGASEAAVLAQFTKDSKDREALLFYSLHTRVTRYCL